MWGGEDSTGGERQMAGGGIGGCAGAGRVAVAPAVGLVAYVGSAASYSAMRTSRALGNRR
jgi:hypothetical protein